MEGVMADYKLIGRPYDDRYGRGFVVVRTEDEQALSWRTLPKSSGLRSVNLVGEQYVGDDLQDQRLTIGMPLALVREPDNEHDPNAISVWSHDREARAGYLPAEVAAELAPELDAGESFRCYSMWTMWDGQKRTQLRILLVREDASIELPPAGEFIPYEPVDAESNEDPETGEKKSQLKKCRLCGVEVSPNAKACPKCGEPNPGSATQQVAASLQSIGCILTLLVTIPILFLLCWGLA